MIIQSYINNEVNVCFRLNLIKGVQTLDRILQFVILLYCYATAKIISMFVRSRESAI